MKTKPLRAAAGKPRLTEVQWGQVRSLYQTGEYSIASLARAWSVSNATIAARAKKEGWEPRSERVKKVQEMARERLDGLAPAPGPESASDPMAVAVEAKVQVVLSHRKLISRIRGIVQDLLTVTEYQVAEVRGRIEALPEDLRGIKALEQIGESRAVGENLRTLTVTANQLVTMEREAFGIQAAEGPREETYEERLKRLIAQSKEASK